MGEDEKGNAMSRISQSYVTGLEKYINELRNQVSSLKVELREICTALDDAACDLVPTAVECIKKLKGENEELRKDAERYRYIRDDGDGFDIAVLEEDEHGASWTHGYPPEELDAAIDAAKDKGE